MAAVLVAVQLETNHYNDCGGAFYAYFNGDPTPELKRLRKSKTFKKLARKLSDSERHLTLEEVLLTEEVPNQLSTYTGLKRWFLGMAV